MIGARLKLFLAAVGAAFVAGLTLALKWAGMRRKADQAKALRKDLKQVENVQDAIETSRAGGASWRDRLRKHNDK